MKIEKITENKIRAIVNIEDLEKAHTDLHSIMTKALETQGLVLEILSKAEKEVGFKTDGCKLLIEAFSSSDNSFVFTITKYHVSPDEKDINNIQSLKKKLIAKRKSINLNSTTAFFSFDNFENFCAFSNCVSKIHELDLKLLSKNSCLYLYNNTYYLVLSKINVEYPLLNRFYSTISEFGKVVNYSKEFENKLLEHGTVIMKKHAISTCVKYFSDNAFI